MKIPMIRYFLLLVLPIMFFSCKDDDSDLLKQKEMRLLQQYLEKENLVLEPMESGLYFMSNGDGNGLKPSRNDWVIIRYTARLINDRIFDTTDELLAVQSNIFVSSVIYGDRRLDMATLRVKGIHEGLQLMKEGEKAFMILPSHLAYGSSGSGIVPPYSTIIYDIELVKVIKDPVEYEQTMINDYLALYNDSTHLVIEQKASGIYFIELSPGTGENHPANSDHVKLYYTGSFTDGKVFDSKTTGTPYEIVIGSSLTIPGFEEGVTLMKKEGKARILLPSKNAYGIMGSGDFIPGYTPLVFDLELLDIKE
jgi:FKBP-type peptidyl-prolyl cis-trans isomerase FkpA